jgi:hypothetical protein
LTSVSASPPRRDHWIRAVGYGLLAEVSTIITIIAIMMVYRYVIAKGLSDADYAAFGERVGGIVGIVGGTIYTFLFARLLMRRVAARHLAHGVVVALAAIALSVGGSLAGHHGVPAGYIVATILKLVAGATAGVLAARDLPVSA